MNNSIALLIPYFGGFPDYFPYYLHSLKFNQDIHAYIFTDCTYDGEVPPNCSFIQYSTDDFKASVEKEFSIDCNITNPIKLCDYKPAYGIIFRDYIQDYKYWAFGDIDVIYGDVLGQLPDNWEEYDAISMSKNWVSGSFFILRNTDRINNLFKMSEFWKEAFSSNEHHAFDECHHLYQRIRTGEDILRIDRKQSFTYILKNRTLNDGLKIWFNSDLIIENIQQNSEYIKFNRGITTQYDGSSYAYFHLICQKKDPAFRIPKWSYIPEKYYINRYGIATESDFFNSYFSIYSFIIGNALRLVRQVQKIRKIPGKIIDFTK